MTLVGKLDSLFMSVILQLLVDPILEIAGSLEAPTKAIAEKPIRRVIPPSGPIFACGWRGRLQI